MTIVSAVGILLTLAALLIGRRGLTTARLPIYGLLLAMHVGASFYYYNWSLSVAADASTYYFDPYNWGPQPWSLSTKLVTQICYILRRSFGATYLDCFLLFQSTGFAGVMLLARVFDEVEAHVGVPQRQGYLALLFLPSVSFWTSAIGKDAPMFLGVTMCVWAVLNLRSRFFYFCISIGIMVLFRAHVALMAAVALALTAFFGSSTSLGRKLGLLAVAFVGIWVTSGAVENVLGVNATNLSSVGEFLSQQNDVFAKDQGTTSLGNASYPMRAFSLLFRPLFVDAQGLLGIIASVENVGCLLCFLYVIAHRKDLIYLARRVPFIRFVLLFGFIVLLSLTLVYYNVGLGLRERVMAYPMIFSTLVALWSLRQKYSMASVSEQAAPLQSGAPRRTALQKL